MRAPLTKTMRRVALCSLLAVLSRDLVDAEIIDRIAISVGDQVITESEIDNDVRITAFLNAEKLDVSLANKKKSAARLIEQSLVRREMEFSHYPMPALSDAAASLRDLKSRYRDEAAFDQTLAQYQVSEQDVQQRLWWQITLLRFIDYRFRPGIQVSETDVNAYYREQLQRWHQQGIQPVPTLEDSRAKIEEILTQQRIDQELDAWLAEARGQVSIRYHDEELA